MSDAPYFLWDYDVTEKKVREILRNGTRTEKEWMIARLLTSAKYEDIWKFLSVREVVAHFPHLRMRPRDRANWQRALGVWGYAV